MLSTTVISNYPSNWRNYSENVAITSLCYYLFRSLPEVVRVYQRRRVRSAVSMDTGRGARSRVTARISATVPGQEAPPPDRIRLYNTHMLTWHARVQLYDPKRYKPVCTRLMSRETSLIWLWVEWIESVLTVDSTKKKIRGIKKSSFADCHLIELSRLDTLGQTDIAHGWVTHFPEKNYFYICKESESESLKFGRLRSPGSCTSTSTTPACANTRKRPASNPLEKTHSVHVTIV